MKKIFLIFFISLSVSGFAQSNKQFSSDSCRYVLNELSYFWELDSLANNGFRLFTHDRFLKCKLNNITVEELFTKLGKPNLVRPNNQGVEYVYYYYNGELLKKIPGMLEDQLYLVFEFRNSSKYLISINDGVSE
jgi:hypothetical protein